jgi:hypothetical protein
MLHARIVFEIPAIKRRNVQNILKAFAGANFTAGSAEQSERT